jgi:rubrerythrin
MSFTTKELNYIKDGVSWEELIVKKYTEHAQYCQDQEIKNIFNGLAQLHRNHYNHLLGHINGQTQSH